MLHFDSDDNSEGGQLEARINFLEDKAVVTSSSCYIGTCCTGKSLYLQGQEVDAMRRSQAMAEAGDVDGSMVCAQQAETYKKQHDTLQTQLTAPERVMTVCEVCGVFINSTDNDQRRQVRKMTEVSAAERHLQSAAALPMKLPLLLVAC